MASKRTWQPEIVRQVCWLSSRVLLAIALITISFILKKPVENMIQRAQLSDIDKLREDERITVLKDIHDVRKSANDAIRKYNSAALVIVRTRKGNPSRQKRAVRRARKSIEQLYNNYMSRESGWPEGFEISVYDLWYRLDASIEFIDEIQDSSDMVTSLRNRVIIKKELLRMVHRQVEMQFDKALLWLGSATAK